jgi:catechol 2,3-dioxygenase-like lactoylglutathione lyase family enzyme
MSTGLVDGLAVVLLLARDTDRTSAFYRDVLGLPLEAEEHDGRHRHYACRLGSVYFTIQAAADLAAPEPGRGYDFLQLCFTTSDLDAFLARLPGLQLTPLHPPRPFEHTTFTTLLDPDGRHVRVMTAWQR